MKKALSIFYSLFMPLMAVVMVADFVKQKPWNDENPLKYDMSAYYAYLPAAFVHGDLRLTFVDPANMGPYDWSFEAKNGRVIKMTSGVALMQMPFFLAGHFWAKASTHATDGFSKPYYLLIFISALCYAFLGLVILRKWLLMYLPEWAAALTVFIIYFGTNLWYYSTTQGAMSHAYSFFLVSALCLCSLRFWTKPNEGRAIVIGLLLGMIVLIRPVNVLAVLIFALYPLQNGLAIKEKWNMLIQFRCKFLLILIAAGLIAPAIQMAYWQHVSGQWLHYSYHGERFFWNNPKVWDGLFSYRKGWLLWTPVMAIALLGIASLRTVTGIKGWVWLYVSWFVLFTYITFSWWTWWYGGGYGCRPVIEYYPLLALPLGALLTWLFAKSKKVLAVVLGLCLAFTALNAIQTQQYRHTLLHWDAMTHKAYWAIFLKNSYPEGYAEMLDFPDYEAARRGER